MAPRRVWKQRGQSGMWVSDWYENTGAHVDDMTIIRSCWADGINHVGSVCQMNTGSILAGRPSLGAWSTYGLGSANKNLPSFVVMTDDKGRTAAGMPTMYAVAQLYRIYLVVDLPSWARQGVLWTPNWADFFAIGMAAAGISQAT